MRFLKVFVSRLKCFWLFALVAGLSLAVFGANLCSDSSVNSLLIYGGGAIVGLAGSAFFSRPDQFLLRGVRDAVYLVQNNFLWPRVYWIERNTLNALGGVWHEISHLSETTMKRLFDRLGRGRLNLRKAEVYRAEDQNSVCAVLLGTRYGVPNEETLEKIWGPDAKSKVQIVTMDELDKWSPGRDLVSVRFWPYTDQ